MRPEAGTQAGGDARCVSHPLSKDPAPSSRANGHLCTILLGQFDSTSAAESLRKEIPADLAGGREVHSEAAATARVNSVRTGQQTAGAERSGEHFQAEYRQLMREDVEQGDGWSHQGADYPFPEMTRGSQPRAGGGSGGGVETQS